MTRVNQTTWKWWKIVQGGLFALQPTRCLHLHHQLSVQAKSLMKAFQTTMAKVWPKPGAGGTVLGQCPGRHIHGLERGIPVTGRIVLGEGQLQGLRPRQRRPNTGEMVRQTP